MADSLFIEVNRGMMHTPAWRASSHGARSLYFALKERYNFDLRNNGKISLSVRRAAELIRSDPHQIRRWFCELEHYGFIVRTSFRKGATPSWRLTEIGYMGEGPTNDYLRWNGVKYKTKKSAAITIIYVIQISCLQALSLALGSVHGLRV